MSTEPNRTPAAAPTAPSSGPQGLLMAGVVIVLLALGFLIFLIATGRGGAPTNNMVEANAASPAIEPAIEAPPANVAAAAPAGPTPGGGRLLPSGLRIETVREGRGPLVTTADTVHFRYELRKYGGPVIESNLTAPRPAVVPVAGLVPGFAEGLTHMRPGGEARFWVPPQLGYGANIPPGSPFGPDDTLEFRVRLERIAPAPSAAAGNGANPGAREAAPVPAQ